MRTEEIPGGSAVIREPSELRGRDRQLVKAASWAAAHAMAKMPERPKEGTPEWEEEEKLTPTERVMRFPHLTVAEAHSMLELRQACVVAQLVSWTLVGDDGKALPLPTFDTIGDLDGDLYDALDTAVGVTDGVGEVDFSSSRDKESPTTGSSDSAGPSMDDQEKPSTPKRTRGTAASSTDNSSQE